TIDGGGAITVDGGGKTLFIVNAGADATFAGLTLTQAWSAIFNNGGTVTVSNSTIDGNTGGLGSVGAGITSRNGILIVRDSTLSNNYANDEGGGIYLDGGSGTIINSTFTGNWGSESGNNDLSIGYGATVTVTHSTFADNRPFKVGVSNNSTLYLNNSIIAGNASSRMCTINSATVTVRNSLIEDGSCGITDGVDGNLTGDPSLGTLTGSPAYFPLDLSSIAVDAGDNALAIDAAGNSLATDQSGNPRFQGQAVDLGAYEWAPNPTITIVKDATPADGTNFVFTTNGNSTGQYLFQWGSSGSGDGQFSSPYRVAVDTVGNVYVTDLDSNRIQKFDSNGTYLTQWGSLGSGDGQFNFPSGVAVDMAGNVYVADTYNYRIQKFDGDGSYITQWGDRGSGNGRFDTPIAVAVDATENVYIADKDNNRIQKFDSNGTYLAQWGEYGGGDGQFYAPYDVVVDGAGNVYVTDGAQRVQKFDSNGTYLAQWGSSGSGDGQFRFPFGIAINPAGIIYVTDRDNHRVEAFSGSTFSLDDASPDDGDVVTATRVVSALLPGSYTFTEMVTTGWELADLSCDNGNWVVNGNRVTVDLAAGKNVTCTFTNARTITAPVITTQPQDTTIFSGETAVLTVAAGGESLSYQWYQGAGGDIATPISGATGDSFTTPALTGDASYWVRVSNAAGSVDSATATVTVRQLATIVIVKDATPADGTDFGFTSDMPGGSNFMLDDEPTQPNDGVAQSITFTDLMASSYNITETLTTGWRLASASCLGGADSGSLNDQTLTVALGEGEMITCTFSNIYN
ncbi:MAG: SMP-30/gluconolactonase/LRE family protein, partial [Caldilineaceae bacterium]|nr:SMP-30/gluconolactonase/LRE family protein [Caldilineaceae bacterium]